MLCFYHNEDFDGICSAAICKHILPNTELVGMSYDYDIEFPWDLVNNDKDVIMVDFSIPKNEMDKLHNFCDNFIWIDHHKSSIEENNKNIKGIRDINFAACELTWKYMFPNFKIPKAVYYIGRYDVWDQTVPNAFLFQYGLDANMQNKLDDDSLSLWFELFNDDNFSDSLVNDFLDEGIIISKYEKIKRQKYGIKKTFEKKLGVYNCLFANIKANSKFFEDIDKFDKYDICVAFIRVKSGWRVSLYTSKKDIDVSLIAKQYNGGGHQQAARFYIDNIEKLLI